MEDPAEGPRAARFVGKLYEMVEQNLFPSIVSFFADGASFIVHDPRRLEAEVRAPFALRTARALCFGRSVRCYRKSLLRKPRKLTQISNS
jgi:hypothetical protein